MAEFKKTPGSDAQGPGDVFGDAVVDLVSYFAASFWPMIIGGIILFVMIVSGYERSAIPVGIAVILLQGWLTLG